MESATGRSGRRLKPPRASANALRQEPTWQVPRTMLVRLGHRKKLLWPDSWVLTEASGYMVRQRKAVPRPLLPGKPWERGWISFWMWRDFQQRGDTIWHFKGSLRLWERGCTIKSQSGSRETRGFCSRPGERWLKLPKLVAVEMGRSGQI